MQTRNNTLNGMLEIDKSMVIDEMIDIKVVMLGDISVGKTSIVSRFQKNQFDINQSSTVGGSYVVQIKKYNNDQQMVKFQIQDTAGQEQFRSLVSIYYKGAQAAILVYDSTNNKSFQSLLDWFNELQNKGPQDIITIIAANKQDLITENHTNIEKVYDLAKEKKSFLHFTSAKNGNGIEEMFQDLANHFIKTYKKKKVRSNTKLSVINNNQNGSDKKKCCG